MKIRLHYFVLEVTPAELPAGHIIDHGDHDGLNCRRKNLEVVTQTVNMERSHGWKKKGVPVAKPCL
jgi:hypothetical protein